MSAAVLAGTTGGVVVERGQEERELVVAEAVAVERALEEVVAVTGEVSNVCKSVAKSVQGSCAALWPTGPEVLAVELGAVPGGGDLVFALAEGRPVTGEPARAPEPPSGLSPRSACDRRRRE